MLGIIIVICLIFLVGSINDFSGNWVDLKTGKKYTIIPSSIIDGEYITHCDNFGEECSHTIKYNWLFGEVRTPIGKYAKHDRIARCIKWSHRTWHKLIDTNNSIFNTFYQIYAIPRIFGLWYGYAPNGKNTPVIIEIQPNKETPYLYDFIIKKYDTLDDKPSIKIMTGEPQSETKIKVYAPKSDPIIVYWNPGSFKLSCKLNNNYVVFSKIYS
jgi:hypothetical protein